MSSGVWLPAEDVINLSSMSMRAYMVGWEQERENIIANAKRYKWSWFRFCRVEVKQSREQAEKTANIDSLDYFLGDPTRNRAYEALARLCATALNANQLVPHSQVFVSTKDFGYIAPFIVVEEKDDSGHDDVAHSGDSSD